MRNNLSLFNDDFGLFDPFFNSDLFMFNDHKNPNPMKCDIVENDNDFELIFDIPGVNKEDVRIDYENETLTISASRKSENDKKHYVRRERNFFEVKRSFYVGEIDENEIKAKMDSGVLTITIPKEKEKVITKKSINID